LDQAEISQLNAYLGRVLASPTATVRARKGDDAELLIGGAVVAELLRDEDEGELSYSINMEIPVRSGAKKGAPIDDGERVRLQGVLREKLQSAALEVRARPRKTDSVEVYVGEEFVGTVSTDEDAGYFWTMSILDIDLDGGD